MGYIEDKFHYEDWEVDDGDDDDDVSIVSIVNEIPPLSKSISEISKFGLPETAIFNMESRRSTFEILSLNGGWFAKTKMIFSKSSTSATVWATSKWPICGGSNVPPKRQTFFMTN